MKLLNFSHPMTEAQIEAVGNLVGAKMEIYDIKVQIDNKVSIMPQIRAIVDQVLVALEGEYHEYVVNPPGLAVAAVLLCQRLPGHYKTVRMVSDGGTPPRFHVAEVV